MIIPVLIPMKDGHILYPDVYKSILNQTIQLSIIPITRPRLEIDTIKGIDPNIEKDICHGYLSQAQNRNIAVDSISSYKGDFIVMMDCDTVLLENNVIEKAIEKLSKNKNLGVVHINKRAIEIKDLELPHYDIGCIIIRTTILRKITFRSETPATCNCISFHNDVTEMGYSSTYNESRQQAKEINTYKRYY